MLPWGIRNHNPGNLIDLPGRRWNGQVGAKDGKCVFATDDDGLHVLCRQLLIDQLRHHMKTPAQILASWAPPSENPTKAYIAAVCARTGFFDIEPLDLMDPLNLYGLQMGIIWQENGMQPYTHAQLARAVRETLA